MSEQRKQCTMKKYSVNDKQLDNHLNGAYNAGYELFSSHFNEKTQEMMFVFVLKEEKKDGK